MAKFKHKETGVTFETNNENLFNVMEREGFIEVKEKEEKKDDKKDPKNTK